MTTIFGKRVGDFLAYIEDVHFKARAAQRSSHARAHGA
jgi:hypothetical protein